MKYKILKSLLIFVVSFVLMCAFARLRGGYISVLKLSGFPLSMLIYAITYFAITVYFLSTFKKSLPAGLIILLILAGTSFIDIYIRFLRPGGFQGTLGSFPDFVIRIVSVFLGLLYYRNSAKTGKIITLTCSLLFFLWCSYFGFDLWLHRLNFGSFNGIVRSESAIPLNFYRSDGTTVQVQELKHDFTILSFWTTGCGACFREFPAVQQLSDTYQNNSRVGVYGVFCWHEPSGENYKTGEQILSDERYTFPTFSINQNDSVLKAIKVTGYPTVVILNEQGKIAFRGEIEKATDLMRRLIE